jgi:hypothetical protein
MKTKQTKIDRSASKWLPGAMALAATTASSQAATVQITLTGNKISSTGGNQLVADLTGDGVADVVFSSESPGTARVFALVNGGYVLARRWTLGYAVRAGFAGGGIGEDFLVGTQLLDASYLNLVTFTDTRINGGAPMYGYLQVNAFNTSATDHTVELSRLIFDDASTTLPVFTEIPGVQTEWDPSGVSVIPEPGYNLGLLALGAGGLLIRRRLKRAA